MADVHAKPLWMSGTPADDDPMVLAVSKRIRAFRKKLDRIEKTEESANQNDDQVQLLGSKISVIAILQELEKLRETQIRIVMESNKIEEFDAPEREESTEKGEFGESPVTTETQTVVVETEPPEVESKGPLHEPAERSQTIVSRDLLSLFFTARLLDTKLQPSIGAFRDTIKENDRLALQYLTVLVEGSGRACPIESSIAQRIDECETHAEKYLSRSDEQFMPGCSYSYIHKLVDQFVALTPVHSSTSINFFVPSLIEDADSDLSGAISYVEHILVALLITGSGLVPSQARLHVLWLDERQANGACHPLTLTLQAEF